MNKVPVRYLTAASLTLGWGRAQGRDPKDPTPMADEGHLAPDPATLDPARLPAARVTVVESVFWQPVNPPGQVVDIASSSFSMNVRRPSDEQCVPGRAQRVAGQWVPLQLLYLDGKPVSQLIVDNLEGTGRQTVPSDEEIAECEKRVVLLASKPSDDHAFAEVAPACTARFKPLGTVYVRCAHGTARVRAAATPGEEADAPA